MVSWASSLGKVDISLYRCFVSPWISPIANVRCAIFERSYHSRLPASKTGRSAAFITTVRDFRFSREFRDLEGSLSGLAAMLGDHADWLRNGLWARQFLSRGSCLLLPIVI